MSPLVFPDTIERNPDGTPKGYPCCDRKFPDPDPMYRFISDEDGPADFWRLPYDERSRRLRLYLLLRATNEPDVLSWLTAINFAPTTIVDAHNIVDVQYRDDRHIIEEMRRGRDRERLAYMRGRGRA